MGEIDPDARDGETGLSFGNGLKETRHHDKLGRITAIEHSRSFKLQYQYDARGSISGIDYNGLLQSYEYDPLGRVTGAETQLGSYRYAYDSLGNRTYKQHTDPEGNTTTQESRYPDPGEGNRLLSQANGASQSYEYNDAGSPEWIGERHYEYDAHQRPVRLYRADPDDKEKQISETSSEHVHTFTETDFVTVYSTYLNNDCSGTPATSGEVISGTYIQGERVTTSGGFEATEIDFHVTGAVGTALPAAEQYSLYDIYYIDNDVLYFGVERPIDEAQRTDTIDTTQAYIQDP